MQVYYFTRTGRSKKIAEDIASKHGTTARMIDDHHDWSGKINYMKAGAAALSGKAMPADYEKPDINDDIVVVFPLWAGAMPPAVKTFADDIGGDKVTAVVTSLGSKLSNRDVFKKIYDLVGDDIKAPEEL